MQQRIQLKRNLNQTAAKSCIMEPKEKIQSGLKSEPQTDKKLFVDFANSINRLDNQNFIVEWQVGVEEKENQQKI